MQRYQLGNKQKLPLYAWDGRGQFAIEMLVPHNVNVPASRIMPGYDEGGMLKSVKAHLRGAVQETEFVANISYNPKGQRERIKYGNGARTKYEYDEKTFRLTRLLTARNNGADVLQDLNYAYDPVGNITQITDDAQQTNFFSGQVVNPSQEFEYDALYRLVKATGREHVSMNADSEPEIEGYNLAQASPEDGTAMRNYMRRWEYDEVGNILKLIHQANGNSWTRDYAYAAGSNRLNSVAVGQTTVSYNYNEHGSMAAMPHLQEMVWDFAERLSYVTRSTTEAYYNYDGAGQRVRKIVEKGSIIEERLYLGGFEIFRKKVNGNLELERETLHIMDDTRRIAVVETLTVNNGTTVQNPEPVQRYQLGNHLESASLELDENANIISYEEYYPYGDTSYRAGRSVAETGLKRYRYTGKEKDEESGLYYHGARYYACWLGRWTAADPMGMVDGVNLYAYCRENPLNNIDPDGEFTMDTETGIGTIEKGDTLSEITKQINEKFGTNLSVEEIAADNDIEDPNKIYAGNTIGLQKNEETSFRNIIGECNVRNFELNLTEEPITNPANNENGLNKIGIKVEIEAEFYRKEDGSNYNPYCCEYIQEVRGFVYKNGRQITEASLDLSLNSQKFSNDAYGRDRNLVTEEYNDSLGIYKGEDYPGLRKVKLGDYVKIRMEFNSYIKDRCNNNKTVEVKPWFFQFYGNVPHLNFEQKGLKQKVLR